MTISHAAVFRAPRQPITWERFEIPPLQGAEVLARIRCATICGSDLHTYYGRRHSPAPSVLGHEMTGEVAAIGPAGATTWDGHPLRLGDRITWSMVWSCGTCFPCTHELPMKCDHLLKFGHQVLTPGRDPSGGFAEHCLLPEGTVIFTVPDNLPDVVASPATCATATVAAVLREAGNIAGETAVVCGAGMLGLTACAMAASRGAGQVIAIDADPDRLALASQFGATAALAPGQELHRAVQALTGGRGAAVAFDFAGVPEAIEATWPLLRFGGRFLIAGAVSPARDVSLPAEQIVRRLLRISGVYNYAPADLAAGLRFLSENALRYPFASLVERVFPMHDIQQAFEYAETQRPPRVALRPAGMA